MTEQTDVTPEVSIAHALMDMKASFDQLRYHTNGIRQGYLDDGYSQEEASSMAAADHRWLMAMLISGLNGQSTDADL